MTKRVYVWIRTILFLAILPAGLLRVSPAIAGFLPPFHPVWWTHTVATGAVLCGAYVALRAYLILSFIGKRWPFDSPQFLVDKYIYRFVRHPMYWGYTVFWLGIGLLRGDFGFMAGMAAVGAGLMFFALAVEEPELKRRFGRSYTDYRRFVPVLLPTWRALAIDVVDFNWFLLLTMTLARKLFPFLWNVRSEGVEHIPLEGGCVVVCNHVNYVDPFLVGLSFTRPVRFMTTDESFRKPLTRLLFTLWRAFPKRRWARDIVALRNMRKWLDEGQAVGLFPEGARNWDGGAAVVSDEVFRFLKNCNAPILCATQIGGHEAFPRWAKLPSFTQLTVRFFEPLDPRQFDSVAGLRRAIESRIFAFMNEPPTERKILRSHSGITAVAWGCTKCGSIQTLKETKAGLVCQKCGAAWKVTPRLELVDCESGEILLEREYHARLREQLRNGRMEGGNAAVSPAEAFRIEPSGRLTPLGRGLLTLKEDTLTFAGQGVDIQIVLNEVRFAYLTLANHLAISDKSASVQFSIKGGDSPVRWDDYVAEARGQHRAHWSETEDVSERVGQ